MIQRLQPAPQLFAAVTHAGLVYIPRQAPARATVEARIANPAYRVDLAAIAAF